MHRTLGIHIGHHASCALVVDGHLVSAVQQERVTRRKYDGLDFLTSAVPVAACLGAAGIGIGEVDAIVTSFQALSPGGIGFRKPIVSADFDAFDPFDPRHVVISHHRAHALCAVGSAGWESAAALVVDLAGSTTPGGADFVLPYAQFAEFLNSCDGCAEQRTECVSVYDVDGAALELRAREFAVPHNSPETYVQSAASLYDNVARTVFGNENAHGQLMALASADAGDAAPGRLTVDDLLRVEGDEIVFRNDWQHRVGVERDALRNVPLAEVTQAALQVALMHYARRARRLTGRSKLALAGGVFLNILANSEIRASGLFEDVFVPSSPHDAGISVGCAYHGWRAAAGDRRLAPSVAGDRLGPPLDEAETESALASWGPFVRAEPVSPSDVARRLAAGEIVARCAGRSEFGPRALGGRSLLASPLPASSKDRLNAIKGRQAWRPVAPIVLEDRVDDFFEGPPTSPFMNFVHWIRPQYRARLAALAHPDGSTRAQTLARGDDPALYEIVERFGRETGIPVLVNTSLNGPGEPIVQTAAQALAMFMTKPDIDALLLGDRLVTRVPARASSPDWAIEIAPDAVLTTIARAGATHYLLVGAGARSCELSPAVGRALSDAPPGGVPSSALLDERGEPDAGALRALSLGLLVVTRSLVSA